MLFLILIITYILFIIFDYLKIRKKQNIKQNILYIVLFSFSFVLSLADVFEIPLPVISNMIRTLLKK